MNMEKYEWEEMKELYSKLEIAEKMLEHYIGSEYREAIHEAGLCAKHPSFCTVCYANTRDDN
tara:strand:- start:2334 stop:2519 length:186 start_codon:yes stop_codon:yes gene_type:complete